MCPKPKQHKKSSESRVSENIENDALGDANSLQAHADSPTVESDPLERIPQIDENNVDSLSEQVESALFRNLCMPY